MLFWELLGPNLNKILFLGAFSFKKIIINDIIRGEKYGNLARKFIKKT